MYIHTEELVWVMGILIVVMDIHMVAVRAMDIHIVRVLIRATHMVLMDTHTPNLTATVTAKLRKIQTWKVRTYFTE